MKKRTGAAPMNLLDSSPVSLASAQVAAAACSDPGHVTSAMLPAGIVVPGTKSDR